MDEMTRIGIEAVIFLVASYFLFYKQFLKSLGRQAAELIIIKQKIRDVEEVKRISGEIWLHN